MASVLRLLSKLNTLSLVRSTLSPGHAGPGPAARWGKEKPGSGASRQRGLEGPGEAPEPLSDRSGVCETRTQASEGKQRRTGGDSPLMRGQAAWATSHAWDRR